MALLFAYWQQRLFLASYKFCELLARSHLDARSKVNMWVLRMRSSLCKHMLCVLNRFSIHRGRHWWLTAWRNLFKWVAVRSSCQQSTMSRKRFILSRSLDYTLVSISAQCLLGIRVSLILSLWPSLGIRDLAFLASGLASYRTFDRGFLASLLALYTVQQYLVPPCVAPWFSNVQLTNRKAIKGILYSQITLLLPVHKLAHDTPEAIILHRQHCYQYYMWTMVSSTSSPCILFML